MDQYFGTQRIVQYILNQEPRWVLHIKYWSLPWDSAKRVKKLST